MRIIGVAMRTNVPRAMRGLRARLGWRQVDLGTRAGLSRDAVSRVERGVLDTVTLATLDRLVAALDAQLLVEVRWRGADLDRLVDRLHAAVQDQTAARLAKFGWLVQPEVSFNHFGDRGSCDLLAWRPDAQALLVVEVKSRLGDVQDTLRRLDTKARLGPMLAEQLGWPIPRIVGRALVFAEHRTTRRHVAGHAALFDGYALRGASARRWLRAPNGPAPRLLWFQSLPDSRQVRTKRPTDAIHRRPAG